MHLRGETGLSVTGEAQRLASELMLGLPNIPSHRLIKAVQALSTADIAPETAHAVACAAVHRFVRDLHPELDAKRQIRLASALARFPAAVTIEFWTLWAREISRSLRNLTPGELVSAAVLVAESPLPGGDSRLLLSEISRQFLSEDCLVGCLRPEDISRLALSFTT